MEDNEGMNASVSQRTMNRSSTGKKVRNEETDEADEVTKQQSLVFRPH